jgi:hypothetical protein
LRRAGEKRGVCLSYALRVHRARRPLSACDTSLGHRDRLDRQISRARRRRLACRPGARSSLRSTTFETDRYITGSFRGLRLWS